MMYLIIKMLFPLAIMLLVGCWVGWQIRSIEFTQRLHTLQNEWAGRFRSSDRERDIAIKKATTLDLKSKQLTKQLEITGRLIKQFEDSQAEAQATIDQDMEQIKALSQSVDQLKIDLKHRDIKLEKFANLLKTLQKLEREQKAKIRSGAGAIERLMLQAQEKTGQIQQLSNELKNLENTQQSAQAVSSDIKGQYYELQAKLRDRETKLELIKEELDTQKKNASSMEKELHVIQSQVSTSPANDLSINSEQSSRPVWILEAPDDNADDLQKIRGIGPVMERLLNEIGIYHYNQLARMNESDCIWIADRIKTFPKRIKRDRWQQQAVELDLDQLDQQELSLASKEMAVDSTGDVE